LNIAKNGKKLIFFKKITKTGKIALLKPSSMGYTKRISEKGSRPEGDAMKNYTFFAAVLLSLLAVACISCKSTPKTEAPVPSPEPAPAAPAQPGGPSQDSLDALNQAKTRADEARKRALDFEGPGYFPGDWEETESQYAAAGKLPGSTNAELQQAASAFNAVAGSYDEIFKKTIPLYAQAREDEIIAARDELIATGLEGTFPEYLRKADDIALAALNQYEAQDYYAARDTAAAALNEYQALKTGADAYLTRQEILKRNFAAYDPENFSRAEEIALSALDDHEAGNTGSARDKAEEALLRYNLALANGWAAFALVQRDTAAEERQRALDAKANVAVKETFDKAERLFTEGTAFLKDENYESAANQFNVSIGGFRAATEAAEEKRRIAEEIIREAEEKIHESDETARQAELIIEGGSR
jgi:hypothetical protein